MSEEDFTPQEITKIAEEALEDFDSETDAGDEYDFEDGELADKVAALKERLSLGGTPDETLSPEAIQARLNAENPEKQITGADVDWSEYDLDPSVAHLYARAILREENGMPQWVSYIDEFITTSRSFDGEGRLNKKGEPSNGGEYASMMVNGKDGWRLVAFLPNGTGFVGIILQRRVPVALPMPTLLQTTTEVAPLTDEELNTAEVRGMDWAAEDDEDVAAAAAALEEDGEVSFEEVKAELARKAGENPVFAAAAEEALNAIEGADYVEPTVADPSGEEK